MLENSSKSDLQLILCLSSPYRNLIFLQKCSDVIYLSLDGKINLKLHTIDSEGKKCASVFFF